MGFEVIVDYKKSCKDIYLPKTEPSLITLPPIAYAAVKGTGDPNTSKAYKEALELLYGLLYTIKMSKRSDHSFAGYFDYVVPPLEGFWWQPSVEGVDYKNKQDFHWISVIRVPDFVTRQDFDWAVAEAEKKKKTSFADVEFITVEEGLCVQMMHVGAYDDEPESVALMDAYLAENGYASDFSDTRLHHEIYLSDARKTAPEKLKTVIRHPVKKI